MSGIFTKALRLPVQYPLVRGMLSYAVVWPTCSLVQEYLVDGTSVYHADWGRATRFGVFGTFFMAPVFYTWMKFSNRFFTGTKLKTALARAAVEQLSYTPLALAYFFFGMSLLEGKSLENCIDDVKEKFWPTYKKGLIFWPSTQTINFYFVRERDRILFVSAASFIWTIYLAHVVGKKDDI